MHSAITVRGHHRARTEGAKAVVTSQATNAQDNPLVGFGPNEWIVEDMYQRYLADPASVDPAWHDFFADYRPAGEPVRTAAATVLPPRTAGADRRPAPPRAGHRTHRRSRRRPPAVTAPPATRPPRHPRPRPKPAPATAEAKAESPPAPTPRRSAAWPRRSFRTWTPRCRCPPPPACGRCRPSCIADNRIVINNHLARGRGGKVSFTHIIGYAMVKALASIRR